MNEKKTPRWITVCVIVLCVLAVALTIWMVFGPAA